MKPIIDHIQITVKDMKAAEAFYDRFLPILGFDISRKVEAFIDEHDFHVIEYTHDLLAFAITSPRQVYKNETIHRRKPGALHHLAFKAETREEVELAYMQLQKIGAAAITAPKLYPEYGEKYYAIYFKDTQNIKYEIVCNQQP